MFTHICVSANDLDVSGNFYKAVLEPLGIADKGRFSDRTWAFGKESGGNLLVTIPMDGQTATHSNGGTIGLSAPSREAVDAFYKAALEMGGTDEGAPGPRFRDDLYAAYVRDPVGNKLCAYYGMG